MESFLCLEFITPVICISRKRNGIRQKKWFSCSKMWFYYLTANKIRDVFRNFEPLASLRPHLCKSVNFSRFIKNDTTPHIVFVFSSRD